MSIAEASGIYPLPMRSRADAGCRERLSDSVRKLLAVRDLDAFLDARPRFFASFTSELSETLDSAFVGGRERSLRDAHKALYFLYEEEIGPVRPGTGQNQYHPFIIRIRNDIERAWERFEMRRLDLVPSDVPAEPDAFLRFLKARCFGHRLDNHPLFSFLEHEADHNTIVDFFLDEGTVALRFCDLIVLSMVGADEDIRCELARNFWDEVGNGNYQNRHTELYRRLLRYAGPDPPETPLLSARCFQRLDWQGLAGYNLYLFLALHRRNFFRSVGCLGVAEMKDPAQYEKIIRGCYRVGLRNDLQLAYYVDHVEIDKEHGDGWFNNVMAPIVRRHPEAAYDIAAGALMRLNTGADYYDYLLKKLSDASVRTQEAGGSAGTRRRSLIAGGGGVVTAGVFGPGQAAAGVGATAATRVRSSVGSR